MDESQLKNARVLIVDDEEVNITLLTGLLQCGGYEHLQCTTEGSRVMELSAAFQPDIILLDLLMPKMDGFAVMTQLRASMPEDSYLPILVLTGDVSPQTRKRALTAGANDFLTKPLDVTETLLRIKNLLETRFLHLQLKHQNLVLEDKVRERTANLQKANEAFQALVMEQRQTQAKLAEQAALLDKAQDAIFLEDLRQGIRYWNQSATRLYGWPEAEARGRKPAELLYRLEKPEPPEARRQTLEQGEWIGELAQVTRNNKDLIVQSRWTRVLDHQAQPEAILVVNTDITEKKALEAQFLRAQRMESIGRLASGIAHDLNNVLTPILMVGPVLRGELANDKMRDLLDSVVASAQRGADIVKQVLTFASGMKGERVTLQLRHLLSELDNIVRHTFPKNIMFQAESPKNLWTIVGDASQLHQVMLNLCVNARDAMPNGGTLHVIAENMWVDETYARMIPEARPGPYVLLQVADTGSGIPSEILDKIFEPFFTTKGPEQGTGLGLSTVLGVVKNHNGFIQVHTQAGQGTTFAVYLPAVAQAGGQAEAPESGALPEGHGELVLVVEDEAVVRESLQRILEKFHYQVKCAADGAEALAYFAAEPFAIQAVICDMAMPNMDGPTAIRAMRQMNARIKIISLSGLSSAKKLNEARDLDLNAFLNKPCSAQKLLATLHQVLRAKA